MKRNMKKLAILAVLAMVAAVIPLGGVAVAHPGQGQCDAIVANTGATDDIKSALAAASAGDTICLSDSDGDFAGEETATISANGVTVRSASAAVITGGSGPAFRLADGVSNVTIRDLEIEFRTGVRGGGIEAWDRTTSNITIRNNDIHDNSYSGVLVGSEGGFIHSNWMVKDNTVADNGVLGIELTNCENCTIMGNDVDPHGFAGIVVQARNTPSGGVGSVHINGVNVLHNRVDGAGFAGIYVLALESLTTGEPFPPSGAIARLTNVNVNNNAVSNFGVIGVIYWAFNAGAMADNGRINHNVINCTDNFGVGVFGVGRATAKNIKVVNNSFAGCAANRVINSGAVAPKLPPGPIGSP